ncbi:hypothetical protein GPUN_2150 [Glaciecola punicea ACAM 611]|jgi:hypothetical protein|uniref:DUF3010 domain-containing protein n=1 Tax=Glaciecola punicea ACAM 611 TaxID=1121923 RepID=H5TD88_9ALTE|nr:DUF3010 family protein [Glaciecola punicea]GAB56265.1 hypothetical protein GPUN_2150 [Glaciecola punicea ACAM 611]
MKICGIEIKGTEAVICLLSYQDGLFTIPDCRVRKVDFSKENKTSDIRYFQSTFAKLTEDYKINKVIIKERPLKGKFAGGGLGFKMESAIQLISSLDVELMSATALKESLKRNPVTVSFGETGLKIFQQNAFEIAYAAHMNEVYGSGE